MFTSSQPAPLQFNVLTYGVDPTGQYNSLVAARAAYAAAAAQQVATGITQTVYWPPGEYLIDTSGAYGGAGISVASGVWTYMAGGATIIFPYTNAGGGPGYCICFLVNQTSQQNIYFLGSGTIQGTNPTGAVESPHWGILFNNSNTRYGATGLYSSAGGLTFKGFVGKGINDQSSPVASGMIMQSLTFGQGLAGNALGATGAYTDATIARIRISAVLSSFTTPPGESIIMDTGNIQNNVSLEDIVSTGWANLNISSGTRTNFSANYVSITLPAAPVTAPALNVDHSTMTGCIFTNCVFDASPGSANNNSYGMEGAVLVWNNNQFLGCVFKSVTGEGYSIFLNGSGSGNIINNLANSSPSGTGNVNTDGVSCTLSN